MAKVRQSVSPLPASDTKHLGELTYRLPRLECTLSLTQVAGDGTTTGSTLWLSSQILACYLQSRYDCRRRTTKEVPRAIDLGAGIGLTSLVLERLGWRVMATDVPPPLHTVLQPNIARNSLGNVQVAALDWTSFDLAAHTEDYDLLVTADTVYEPKLVDGLLSVIADLLARRRDRDACPTAIVAPRHRRACHALIALERRDTKVVDYALSQARDTHHLSLQRIHAREVRRAVDDYMTASVAGRRGADATWPREAWDDVEIWRAELSIKDG